MCFLIKVCLLSRKRPSSSHCLRLSDGEIHPAVQTPPPIQIYCTLGVNAFLNLRDLSVPVWIWLRNINGRTAFFCAYSLKIIVFCSADHRLAPPQSCSCSLSQHKPCVLRRDYQCLPLLTAQTNGRRRCSPFSSVVSGSQHQIPSCLSLQSAGQTCSQPSSLKQSSKNGWTWSRRSVSFWILRGRICFLSAVSVFHSSSEDYSVLR